MTKLRAISVAASALAGATLLQSLPAPAQVDPNRVLDQFEATFGKFEGFRRSGAKGVCAVGEFTGSAEGRLAGTGEVVVVEGRAPAVVIERMYGLPVVRQRSGRGESKI